MLLLLFLLSASCAHAQFVYKRLTYNPRVVRRSAMEALEHLRMPPVSRYFPQVDAQVDPYQAAAYQVYALPPQWTNEAPVDYATDYEYEARPYDTAAYADYTAPQETLAIEPDSALYNDLVASYLMGVGGPQLQQIPEEMPFENVQRRADNTNEIPQVKNASEATTATDASLIQSPAPVQVTAVPTSPEKKSLLSSVVVAPPSGPAPSEQEEEGGQKEEPLFRPLQSSQRTIWSERHRKSPIPLLKQMIQSGQGRRDSLADELSSLKKKTL